MTNDILNSSDIKKTWSIINNTKSKTDNHFDFVLDNQIMADPQEVAIKFNDYFLIKHWSIINWMKFTIRIHTIST